MPRATAMDEDTPAQEAARVAQAERAALAATIKALARVTMPVGHGDKHRRRRLLAADLDRLSREDRETLERLAWRYRRQMPRHLVPAMNPDDPIVRETRSRPDARPV